MTASRPLAIAHRGAPLVHRENTLASFAAALELGADWIELDVHLTREGELVVLHDPTLERLWEVPRAVADLTTAQIGELTNGGVPLLGEALQFAQHAGIRLIVDVSTPSIAAAAARACQSAPDDHVGFTGDPEGLGLIRQLLPGATLLFSWESVEPPAAELLAAARPQYLNQDARLLSVAQVEDFHAQGMKVSTYTVDAAEDIDRVLAAGVDAVISNDVGLLRERIDTREAGDE